jgi:hypothetical protein
MIMRSARPAGRERLGILTGSRALGAVAAGILAVGLIAGQASALSVSSNHVLNAGSTIAADEAGSDITPSAVPGGGLTNGWLYDLGDRNGDGTRTDPVSTGNLDLGAYKLFTDGIDRDLYFNLNGGNLTGTNTFAIMTKDDTDTDNGDIVITNVKNIACGILATMAIDAQDENAGNVQIGTASLPANLIRVDGIKTYGLYKKRRAADCTIYATNDVTVASEDGTPGSIEAHTGDPNINENGGDGGDIDVFHDGAFSAGDLTAYSDDAALSNPNGGRIYLNGDWPGDGASGSCVVSNLINYLSRVTYSEPNMDITITGYLSVHVKGDIDGSSTRGSDLHKSAATDVFITNIVGDIEIDGLIDLDYPGADYRGSLTLQTTGDGAIYLNDLDLTNMLYASFDSARDATYIEGVVTNFSAGDSTIRTPAGQTVYYDESLNIHLGGAAFDLKALDGTSDGGQLVPEPSKGILILVK